ncbi:transcription factor VIP1 isoform X1 [Cinnamomum micranthum f. kanehirae]|uniref:Transcription factor VIP1 isoform X1 n=1 Tax=Cinnamomum micranthum f. kanehirae TaxID=337451 RepID=A0A3S3NUL5_9MAGN|nr:transcription factor VIP1 isoform X1 [Cinnamomum micranthum f. kanehirae]
MGIAADPAILSQTKNLRSSSSSSISTATYYASNKTSSENPPKSPFHSISISLTLSIRPKREKRQQWKQLISQTLIPASSVSADTSAETTSIRCPTRHDGAPTAELSRETFFRLPSDDEILFDADADFSLPDIQMLPQDTDSASFQAPVDSSAKLGESNGGDASKGRVSGNNSSHFRSLSVDAAFFESLGLQPLGNDGQSEKPGGGGCGRGAQERGLHRHSNSMDGSTSSFEADTLSSDYSKKAMAPDKLAELALIDPKRAKRILANRQSAARSKERKIRYTSELERKRDTTGLTTENKELKLRLQAMEQQAHLRDALNEALREEVQRLKIATGQIQNVNGNAFNRGSQQSTSFFSHSQQMHHMGGHQTQQVHLAQVSPNGPTAGGQSPHGHGSMDFMRGSNNNI